MKRKELTKTVMMISNWKKTPLVFMVLIKKLSALRVNSTQRVKG